MSKPQIKVEIVLPLRYNDKTLIEKVKFTEVYDELLKRFIGYTINPALLSGNWKSPETGRVYKDEENLGLYIICEDCDSNKEFFTNLKEKLKKKFEQEDILMFCSTVQTF